MSLIPLEVFDATLPTVGNHSWLEASLCLAMFILLTGWLDRSAFRRLCGQSKYRD